LRCVSTSVTGMIASSLGARPPRGQLALDLWKAGTSISARPKEHQVMITAERFASTRTRGMRLSAVLLATVALFSPCLPVSVKARPAISSTQAAWSNPVAPAAASSPLQSAAPAPAVLSPLSAAAKTGDAKPVLPESPLVGQSAQPPAAVAPTASTVRAPGSSALGALPTNLSPWSMFLHADVIVKAVMVGLALASFVTWTIWLAKGLELLAAKRRARSAARKLERADSLGEAAREIDGAWTRRGPVADLVQAALRETQRSSDLSAEGVKERLAIALSRIEARAGRSMARGTGLLATIGATAPFVGLFGTVWGIMNSFIGISKSHTTNLAVVAPGIAEALLATAIGLVAAIPAVIVYNVFARSIAGYRAVLSDASGEVLQHLSRDLERRERESEGIDPFASRGGGLHPPTQRAAQAERGMPRAAPLRPAE
jgi:biopolymer transport protein ExbB